jgi:DNA-binding response OmpR family regulator
VAGGHLLLVEDSALVTDALRILFEGVGHRVRVASTVAAAIAACERERPDVMLLDLTLPDGDGLRVLAGLRDSHARPRITAAMTGRDEPAVRDRCLAAGCAEVLVKPVPTRELLRKIDGWLEDRTGAADQGA